MIVRAANRHDAAPPETLSLNSSRCHLWYPRRTGKPQILESSSASIPPRISLIPNTTFLPNPGRLQKNEPRAGLRSVPTSADPGSPGRPEKPQILKNSSASIPPRISLILNTTFLPNPGRLQKNEPRAGLRSALLSTAPGSPARPEKPQIPNRATARIPPRNSLIPNTAFLLNPGRLQKCKSRGRCTVTRKNRMGADQWTE